jgi:hypothetical protein
MTKKKNRNKALEMAMAKLYAPENCPKKNRHKGKCGKCSYVGKCDKDFSLKFGAKRVTAIGDASVDLAKKNEERLKNLKGHTPPPAPETANPLNGTALTPEQIAAAATGGPEIGPAAPEQAAPAPEGPVIVPAAPEAAPEAPAAPEQAAPAPEAKPGEQMKPRILSPLSFWR